MATKMLKYVNHAKSYHLKINWTGNNLVLFPDAAFAPGGSRSQTGWVIVYAGNTSIVAEQPPTYNLAELCGGRAWCNSGGQCGNAGRGSHVTRHGRVC